MRRSIALTCLTAMLALLYPATVFAGGGGGSGGMGPCAPTASGPTLYLRDFCIDGVAHFVEAGAALTIVNEGQSSHSLTAADGRFDTGLLAPGESAEITVDQPGIVVMYCRPHGTDDGHGMAGVLIVGDPEPAALANRPDGQKLPGELKAHDEAASLALAEQSQRLERIEAHMADLRGGLQAAAVGLGLAVAVVAALVLSLRTKAANRRAAAEARPASAVTD